MLKSLLLRKFQTDKTQTVHDHCMILIIKVMVSFENQKSQIIVIAI